MLKKGIDSRYTITYREAAVYNYVIGAVDDNALPFVEELIKGIAYEGDNVTIGYPRYQIKDGQLMQAATTGSEYRMSWTPTADIENLKSITGITIPATEYQPATFAPISYEAQIYKTFAENTVLLMTAENVAAAVAEGWATGGATRVDNKKGNVDPATGEATEKATAFAGIGLKSGFHPFG